MVGAGYSRLHPYTTACEPWIFHAMDRRDPYDLWLHIRDREFNFPKLQYVCTSIWLCRDWLLPGMEQKFIKIELTTKARS